MFLVFLNGKNNKNFSEYGIFAHIFIWEVVKMGKNLCFDNENAPLRRGRA